MICIILAAGIGSRLKPITDRTPKCLIQVGDKPILEHWFIKISKLNNVSEVIVNTHHLHEQVSVFLNEMALKYEFKVSEFYEDTLLGSAGTIWANRQKIINEDVLIVYADNFSQINLNEFENSFLKNKDKFNIAVFKAEVPTKCGIFEVDINDNVLSFEEKPIAPKSDLANGGVYFFSGQNYFEKIHGKEFDIGYNVIPKFIDKMKVFKINGFHVDIGTFELLEKANILATKK